MKYDICTNWLNSIYCKLHVLHNLAHYNYVFARYVITNDIQVHVELNANELEINIVRARFLKRPLNAALKGRLNGV